MGELARFGAHGAGRLKRAFGAVCTVALAALGAQGQAGASPLQIAVSDSQLEQAIQPDKPSVFGTIALHVRPKPTSTRWMKIMRASLDQPRLIRLTEEARALPPVEQVAFVQSAMSQVIRSRHESMDCSDDGYWAPADETLSRGMGDCFDIAIAKMEALRLLGIPGDDLFLTSGYFGRGLESARGHESVALLVRIGARFWLMPEQSGQAIEAGELRDNAVGFDPVFTYGVGETWVHGRMATLAVRR